MGNYIDPPGRRPPRRRRCPRGSREYAVRRGDTLRSIARKFDTTVAELRRLNPGLRRRDLRPGQRICVPSRRTCPQGSSEYVVRRGDTVSFIARKFNITEAELQELNSDVDEIKPGQTICVPDDNS